MTIRRNLKRHKEVMNILADLVTEEGTEDSLIVEILCRKLTELGYLKCEDGYYGEQKNNTSDLGYNPYQE